MPLIRKLAITGANGFLGQNVIKKAIELGWEINGVVRRKEAAEVITKLGAKAYIVNRFDTKELSIAFEDCKAIIHLANVVCGTKELFEQVNINGLKNIIQAANIAKVQRIIYPSGLGVEEYGKKSWASNNYFWSKLMAEEIIINSGIPYTIFRPSYILGPNDELIPELIDQIYEGTVYIVGNGTTPMQPIFVFDAVLSFLKAAEDTKKESKIYELVGNSVVSMLELIHLVHERALHLGFYFPFPRIEYISESDAPERLKICKEMVDVMFSDVIGNNSQLLEDFKMSFSPLEKAINAAIKEEFSVKEQFPEKSALILLSGGIDSVTTLYWAIKHNYTPLALTFNYDYRPKQELLVIRELVRQNQIELVEITLPLISESLELRQRGFPIPNVANLPQGYIPLRNLLFYSYAGYIAEIYGINTIIGGHIHEDIKKFPDVSSEFFKLMEELYKFRIVNKQTEDIKVLLPLVDMSKIETIQLAQHLGVPFDLTWSCNTDGDYPCGNCSSCIERKNAFKELDILDPLKRE